MKNKVQKKSKIVLFKKISEEATVDCYNGDEQISGWVCILEENILAPCNCLIGKEKAILEKIDINDLSSEIFRYIKLYKTEIRVSIEDVILEDSDSMKYIDAYKWWKKNG